MNEISKNFDHQLADNNWYQHWLNKGYFNSKVDNSKPPYTVVIPPPNVTGVLHMGHCLNNTIQDILVRRARMQGFNACWVPGTDHASIATEAKVVAMLRERGITKSSLTREEFSSKWNGYTILLEPTANFDKTEEYKTSFWQLFDLVKPHWIILFEVFIASIFIQIFGLVMPIFTQLILDQVIVQGSLDTLMAMGIGLVIFGLFKVAITGLRSYLLIHTAKRIDLSMIMGFIYHTLTLKTVM